MKRKIVSIAPEKCSGCGLCIEACHEGAIALVDGKARLVKDSYCDGLGACLGECPQGAITIEEREANAFDEAEVKAHLAGGASAPAPPGPSPAPAPAKAHAGCPGLRAMSLDDRPRRGAARPAAPNVPPAGDVASELRQWPIQLHLVPVSAPYWDQADLLVSADCVAHAYGAFQAELLRGRRLIIACPKLDETDSYVGKLAAIVRQNAIRSVTVAHMEVPCCNGLVRIVEQALAQSGKVVPYHRVQIGIRGDVLERV